MFKLIKSYLNNFTKFKLKIQSDTNCDLINMTNSENATIYLKNELCKVESSTEKMSKNALKKLIRKEKKIEKKKLLDEAERTSTNENISILQKRCDLILEKHLSETEYYFENGLRKVYPYFFNYSANAKGRWFNKKIVHVFCTEIQGYTKERCVNILEKGLLKVNDKKVDENYIIKNGDIINNYVHRHELPVTKEPIQIIYENEEVLIVNKPSSIPMHPCGRYRHNSLLYILAKEHGYKRLHTIHRIDRLTSGLVIFCKNERKAKQMAKCIVNRTVLKEYVCKVEGIFPQLIECNEPIDVMCVKNGIYKVSLTGKPSKTVFERIHSDESTSIVKCTPLTGRTHQIRVHLQYLGYPIVNDPLYNNPAWGSSKGKGADFGRLDSDVIKDLMKFHSSNLYLDTEANSNTAFKLESFENELLDPSLSRTSKHINLKEDVEEVICTDNSQIDVPLKKSKLNIELLENETQYKNDNSIEVNVVEGLPSAHILNSVDKDKTNALEVTNSKEYDDHMMENYKERLNYQKDCLECNKKYKDPTEDQLIMFLHAVKYEGPDWMYSTPIPRWAQSSV